MIDSNATELLLTLPLIDSDTKLIHATSCVVNGETFYGFEEMTAVEYAKRFDAQILPNGWPNGMSVLDMGLSLRGIDKECSDAFVESVFGKVVKQ